MEKRLINIKDAAVYLGLTVNTLRCMCSRRTIPFVKIGRTVKFDILRLNQMIKDCSIEVGSFDNLPNSGHVFTAEGGTPLCVSTREVKTGT